MFQQFKLVSLVILILSSASLAGAAGCESEEERAEQEAIRAAEAAAAKVVATRSGDELWRDAVPPELQEPATPNSPLLSPPSGAASARGGPPSMSIDPQKEYAATIKTNMGDIKLDLFAEAAPQTVNNFVFLARDRFYDGVIFHRIIDDFMIQGGDPSGTGRGGPGYQFADETQDNPNRHEPFTLSMANAGPNTNGSQFFITEVATPHLDGKHTVFGRASDDASKDIVTKIAAVPTAPDGRPRQPVVIETITITENGEPLNYTSEKAATQPDQPADE